MAENTPEPPIANGSSVICVLTPAGRGAIAVVAIAGPQACGATDSLFLAASGRPLSETPVRQIAFGHWADATGEEVVATRFAKHIEIHCHGGVAASRAIVKSLEQAGCTEIDSFEWLTRTTNDSISAAAIEQLCVAATEPAALVLLDQLNGALSREIQQTLAHLEADHLDAAASLLGSLAERWTTGQRLSRPARVVLTGSPNVGKSSLINALVGYQRAIVFPAPGTTRDVVTATTAVNGWTVELTDTAGLRTEVTGIELSGIKLAREVIARADLVLRVVEAELLLDGGRANSEFDAWLVDRPVLEVANKIDRLTPEQFAQLESNTAENLVLSSVVSPTGIDALLTAIGRHVAPRLPPPGSAVPFTEQQFEAISAARATVATGDRTAARQALLALLH